MYLNLALKLVAAGPHGLGNYQNLYVYLKGSKGDYLVMALSHSNRLIMLTTNVAISMAL
jgi:hypothetical protein